uniref:SUMO-activating enzyme subunit n=1 Tax=Panagrellus redivivus TaxID=6233 RepID=A0A7E4W2I3_PANRE
MTWKTDDFKEGLTKPVLVVGAGGIGCELLKNLAQTGFTKIHVVDLDTIDISNLNRQFLFRKEHVSKSKAEIATAAVKAMNPKIDITFDHGSVISDKYDINYLKQFVVVFNALDNFAARAHVNRICLAADVPLIESGSAGYKGNVFTIIKGKTECFECLGKPQQKSFPNCTIRNTPSEFVHCVVWAKSVFNQLFGQVDPDEDVSPSAEDADAENKDVEDKPEANGDEKAVEKPLLGKSVREIASQSGYDPQKVFHKLFSDDITYLLTMTHLWKERRPPRPLTWEGNSAAGAGNNNTVWPLQTWEGIFTNAVNELGQRFAEVNAVGNVLDWDKDDEVAMNFVAAASNIRANIFNIPMKSVFDIKSMAGNIIPAIATTNAMVAGMIVIEAIRLLRNGVDDLRAAYAAGKLINNRLISSSKVAPPNAKCFICGGGNREIHIAVNVEKMRVATFQDVVLKKGLSFAEPDVVLIGPSTIIISSEDDVDPTKTLHDFGLRSSSMLDCDDFKQDLTVKIIIEQDSSLDEKQYEIRDGAAKEEPMEGVASSSAPRKRVAEAVENGDGILSKRSRIEAN